MIEIQLTQGQIAWIDDCDADLAELKWYATYNKAINGFYAQRSLNPGSAFMHRVILSRMLGRELTRLDTVDHVHHKTTDNRRSEIRLASYSENMVNRPLLDNNTSGYIGVTWARDRSKWYVRVSKGHTRKHVGYFDDLIEAALAYDKAAEELFGNFAQLNFKE